MEFNLGNLVNFLHISIEYTNIIIGKQY